MRYRKDNFIVEIDEQGLATQVICYSSINKAKRANRADKSRRTVKPIVRAPGCEELHA